MAVIYVYSKILNKKVPKLHNVIISNENYNYRTLSEWCAENCKGLYYLIPEWSKNIGCQFEDDEDAALFALRWS